MWKKQIAVCGTVVVALASKGPPDAGQGTFQGCTCATQCEAGIADFYTCDSCKTEGACGNFAFDGKWDFCKYPGGVESKSFREKSDQWWASITADTTRASKYPSVSGILQESSQTTFDNMKVEMPAGREKKIHTIGSICKFDLNIARNSPFTGLLGPGRQEGFIRMGSAVDYSNGGLTPGLGFKFPRTGVHSGDFVALHDLGFGQSWNFFKSAQSNHIAPPSGLAQTALVKKFNQASQCAPQVGLSDLAKYSQDGVMVAAPKFPFKLFMVPSEAVQTPDRKKTPDEVHAEMAAFPVGTTLYTVYGCRKPMSTEVEMTPADGGLEKACGNPILLGDIVTTSRCTTSAYGDAKLQIRHQRIEEDWQLEPSFLTGYDAAKACGWGGKISANGAPKTCGKESALFMLASDMNIDLQV